MKPVKTITALVLCIVALATLATTAGIFSDEGPGPYAYNSIRGQQVMIYGKGIYQHMSAEVAPQGIAQDVVTLGIGIPLLLLSLWWYRKGSARGRFLLAGTLGYFLVTYLFYTVMGMYNALFLVYVALLSTSFFAFLLSLLSFPLREISTFFSNSVPSRFIGGFLIFSATAIALLWLSIVVPPLLKGTIPVQVEHYTTLVVQGLDLGLLLPAAFITGVLLIRRETYGYLLAPVYVIFLSLMMTALTAKIIAMALAGYSVFPAVVVIPLFNLTAVICAMLLLKNIRENKEETAQMKETAAGNFSAVR